VPPSCLPGSTQTDSDDARSPESRDRQDRLPLSWDLHSINLKFLVLISTCHAPQGLRESSVAPPPVCVSFQVCAEVTIQNTGGARACKPLLVPRATNYLATMSTWQCEVGYLSQHNHLPEGASYPPQSVAKSRMRGPSGRVTPLLSPHVRGPSEDAMLVITVQVRCFIKEDCALGLTPCLLGLQRCLCV
jgi:hypothetical protein